MGLLSGSPPQDLGVQEGRLAPCRETPNCVSSFADPADAVHYVMPLQSRGDVLAAFAQLEDRVSAAERAAIVRSEPDYLRVEYTSRMLGFVDDLELLLDRRESVIHVRSASRLGRRDFGVNRDRVESLRTWLAQSGL